MEIGGIRPRQPDPPGKQDNPYNRQRVIQKNAPIVANTKEAKKKKKKTPRLTDYTSEEFKTCKDVIMYSDKENYADDKDVIKSCIDLAIDG